MELDDRLTISTPEGVDLDLTLAGVGSRFTAALIDGSIQAAIVIALTVVAAAVGWGGVAAALWSLFIFLVFFGYDVAFEVLAAGRTPGKRLNGLRVVRATGQPVTLVTSFIRNILRLVDFLPVLYLVGIGTILATKRNQRLGDLAAGTIVVRDRFATMRSSRWGQHPPRPSTPDLGLDVSAISAEELRAVESFLARRHDIDQDARRQLGHTLAERLRPKVGGIPAGVGAEQLLEAISASKAR
jgi:uncharacterized RDD family membrane protein YckC